MQKHVIYLLIGLLFLSSFSCQPEEEEPVVSDDLRDRLENTWSCDENSSIFDKSIKTIYTTEIVKDTTTSNMVLIYNFYQLGSNKYLRAKLSGSSLTITNQILDGNTINGTGNITNSYKKIEWTYYVDDGSGSSIDTCTAIYTPAF